MVGSGGLCAVQIPIMKTTPRESVVGSQSLNGKAARVRGSHPLRQFPGSKHSPDFIESAMSSLKFSFSLFFFSIKETARFDQMWRVRMR